MAAKTKTPGPRTVSFHYQAPFPLGPDKTKYRLLTKKHVRTAKFQGGEVLIVEPEALTLLAKEAMRDISFFLRPAHQKKVAAILGDPEASDNDRSIALALLRNSAIAAKLVLPTCQDTGTATVMAKKGQRVWTGAKDEEFISRGVWSTYTGENLRYSQVAPLTMFEEKNTGDNLPAQIDIYATEGMEYKLLFLAKGGGSANKTMVFQQTKAVLNGEALRKFLAEKMKSLGTAACPPYHLAFVIGGTSAEACLKTVKLASAGYLDSLPAEGNKYGRAFRDLEFEKIMFEEACKVGYGAQFGGKYFAHDVRVIRLPRHGASCPVGMGVSCSADRNVLAKIDKKGVWLEEMERHPEKLIPKDLLTAKEEGVVPIDLNRPMWEILAELTRHKVTTRLALTGRLVVARDIAHAKLKERLDGGEGLPQYFKDHPVYYAGPAKKPDGKPSGSFGPTTSGRMDSYVDLFQSHGASRVMLGKGNRTRQVTDACKKHGGFYLGSAGGVAALFAENCIKNVEVIDYPELGMEAVWAIDVVDFPAAVLVDDKGNDFFRQI